MANDVVVFLVFVDTENISSPAAVPMMIVGGESKRLTNLAKHGFDFADVDEGLTLTSVVVPAKENRPMAIGRLWDGTIAVVFAVLGTEGGQPK